MARYSLFVLKVPFNPKQTNKQSWWFLLGCQYQCKWLTGKTCLLN